MPRTACGHVDRARLYTRAPYPKRGYRKAGWKCRTCGAVLE